MTGYPIHLVGLEGRRVLVAGGGAIAAAKISPLLDVGAKVHMIAPEIADATRDLLPRIARFDQRAVREGDVEGAALVIAATDSPEVNRGLAAKARSVGILVNAVDDPSYCTFFAPAVIRRGPITIAIGTDGRSPLLAAQLRRLFEAILPASLTSITELFTRVRARGWKGLAKRSKLLLALSDPSLGKLVDRGDTDAASTRLEKIARAEEERFEPGTVAIVGAGPGSKGLLTLRGLDRIQRADVILHDALVESEILDLALPGTRILNVGRRAGLTDDAKPAASSVTATREGANVDTSADTFSSQAMTNALLIREAKSGARVVRLHAGDPFVFGRGSEETDALDAAGVRFESVPGVSSVLAAPAAAGIPLTHRGEARGFTVRTGHTRSGYTVGELPKNQETVVVLMGLGAIHEILEGLVAEGHSADTPAAAISCATRSEQRVVTGTLSNLAARVMNAKMESPTTLIIGEVVRRVRAQETTKSGSGPNSGSESKVAGAAA